MKGHINIEITIKTMFENKVRPQICCSFISRKICRQIGFSQQMGRVGARNRRMQELKSSSKGRMKSNKNIENIIKKTFLPKVLNSIYNLTIHFVFEISRHQQLQKLQAEKVILVRGNSPKISLLVLSEKNCTP